MWALILTLLIPVPFLVGARIAGGHPGGMGVFLLGAGGSVATWVAAVVANIV